MKILVANLGSTSFKYRLFDMADERQLARGGIERIGAAESSCFAEIGGVRRELTANVPDHAEAVRQALAQLTDPASGCLKDAAEVSAIGFKAVLAGRISGVQRVNAELLAAMEEMSPIAPAHNPAYIAAMRQLGREAAADSAGGGFRNRLSPDDSRPQPVLRRALRVGRGAPHQALGLPRGEPSLHRHADSRAAGPQRFADHLLLIWADRTRCARIRSGQSMMTSMGMSPQSGCLAQQPRGRFRSLCPARAAAKDRQVVRGAAGQIWPSGAGCWV